MTEVVAASDPVVTSAGGAKVTIHSTEVPVTPSQELKGAFSNERMVTDALGHIIKLKRPSVVAEYKFIEALGDSASNQVFFTMTMPLLWVASIDGMVVAKPTSKGELYALMQRLGDEGVAAILEDANRQMEESAAGTEAAAKNG